MKRTKKRHVSACLLCMAIFLLSAVPAFAVSYTTSGYFTTLDVQEDSSMHVTEEIYVDFTESAHGIYRYIPEQDQHAYFVYDGELVEAPLVYEIKNVTCEGEIVDTVSEDGQLIVRIGDPDRTVFGPHKYTLEYDIVMYDDQIDYLDQLYWNGTPSYWETPIDFASVTVNMPKPFDGSQAEYITGIVGQGDTDRATWSVEGNSVYGYAEDLDRFEGITVRIVLPEGYWVGAKNQGKFWHIAEIIVGAITAFIAGLFLVKGRDEKGVKTVEFYPPDDLSPAEIGYIYDNRIDDRDMTSLVMWFASKGYLKIHAEEVTTAIRKKKKAHICLEKVKDLPADMPEFLQVFFRGLFYGGDWTDMDELAESYSFGYAYEDAQHWLEAEYGDETDKQLMEGQKNQAVGCLAGVIVLTIMIVSLIFLVSVGRQSIVFVLECIVCLVIITLCTIFLARPTKYRTQMLGRIRGYRDFIEKAELDRIEKLVEQDPDFYYNTLPYAYVFDLTDKWAKNFEALKPREPDWYVGSPYYMSSPTIFCRSMDSGVRSSISESMSHTSSGSFSSGGGGFSSGGGGFSGGGGGGGGGGGW